MRRRISRERGPVNAGTDASVPDDLPSGPLGDFASTATAVSESQVHRTARSATASYRPRRRARPRCGGSRWSCRSRRQNAPLAVWVAQLLFICRLAICGSVALVCDPKETDGASNAVRHLRSLGSTRYCQCFLKRYDKPDGCTDGFPRQLRSGRRAWPWLAPASTI